MTDDPLWQFISTLLALTRGSDTARSALLTQNLLKSVQASEGRNANLFYSIARLLSRACSKDKTILDIAFVVRANADCDDSLTMMLPGVRLSTWRFA